MGDEADQDSLTDDLRVEPSGSVDIPERLDTFVKDDTDTELVDTRLDDMGHYLAFAER
ncbi:hypothetical protein OG890_22150 [Streptomyces anulatus]|uniref:hypothetical protein n=1 Tax=Streptomyces anulatus TaxID=1892 RepID=UPI002253A857|nr:hypothetical protein [Streptomyces anulatus]MCX4486608.1 hypothetical protein [Streptomyces anulatus]WTD14567.1 hypothetical protein OHA54_37305 [Streptomyces anulatus]WTE07876.1 hypothetical protein OH765_37410 [Streptomyces anulatus]